MTAEVMSMQRKLHTEVKRIQKLPSFALVSKKRRMEVSHQHGRIMALFADLLNHSLVSLREHCQNGSITSLQEWESALADSFQWMLHLRPAKLALWPDLRTRALFLASLIDLEVSMSVLCLFSRVLTYI